MKNTTDISHFGFIGFGLIGGSIAHALRELYPDSDIMAYNYYETKAHPQLELAKNDGILSDISTSLADFSRCDVIFLCAPVMTNVAYLEKLKPYLSKDCIITDVGSVKGNIQTVIEKMGLTKQFVGGHPMTGSEKTGYSNSGSSFLKGAYYILTPTEDAPAEYVDWLKQFVTASGAKCEIMDYKTHDKMTAAISHCPHVVSAALVNMVAANDTQDDYSKLAAGGFKDITRISSSSPEMWQNICMTNSDSILEFLDQYMQIITNIKQSITDGDADAIIHFFETAKKYRDNIK